MTSDTFSTIKAVRPQAPSCPALCYHLPSAALPCSSEPAVICWLGGAGRAQPLEKTFPKVWLAMFSNRSTPIAKQRSRVTERGEKGADKLKPGQFAGQEKKPSTCTAARWVPELTTHLYDSCTVMQLEYKPEFLSRIWHESYFFWTTCCSQKQPLLPSLPGQLQSRDGQCKSLQRPVKVLDTGCSMTGQGKKHPGRWGVTHWAEWPCQVH